jgi:hypothetical protein
VCAIGLIALQTGAMQAGEPDDEKPKLTIQIRPRTGFSPVRITATGQLEGGPDDYEEYYCTGVEWDWGDGTISEFSYDCDPYVAGTSEIQRSFRNSHTFTGAGEYEVRLRLKRKKAFLVTAATSVEVRPSLRDMIR